MASHSGQAVSLTREQINLTQQQMAEELNFSRTFDIHRWSDCPEADALVDEVYARCLQGKYSNIERKHLKVVLLDLYMASLVHPDLKLVVAMGSNAYTAKGSRYNPLKISRKTIDVVNLLFDAGLIQRVIGFHDRSGGQGRRTRIWSSAELLAWFERCQLDAYKAGTTAEQEVIVLRKENGDDEEYEDTVETREMRQALRAYNDLLSRQFIDIRRLEHPFIDLKDGKKLIIGPARQQSKRVFNRSSFANGGRYFGAWWQSCPKEWRREIFINDAPTIEQDYSSLHIALLYARKGINFYKTFEGDAYQLETPSFLESPEMTRKFAKLLLLMALNAKTDKAAYAAFRSNRKEKGDPLGGSLSNTQLAVLLDGLRERHPQIAADLGSDAGITLMREDSRITEHVIKRFTDQGLPVLTVHDSYIVHFGDAELLQETLAEAFSLVTGFTDIRSERMGVVMGDGASWQTERLTEKAMTRSKGYRQRMLEWMVYRNGVNNQVGR